MNMYSKQVSCINKIARHFAMMNFHVTTTFYSSNHGCDVTIFFYDINQSESIESYLRQYKDDNDSLTYDAFDNDDNNRKFYTYKLQKL